MVVGFGRRIGVLLTAFSLWVVASAEYTFFDGISHDFHIPLLGCVALILGSCSSWWTVFKKKKLYASATSISVMTGCFLLSFVFLNAALYKIWFGNSEFLQWALSDAFRNKLLMRYEIWLERPVPDFLLPLVENQLLWQISGLGAIALQMLPFICLLGFKKTLFRIAAGAFFAANILGLFIVMKITWVLPWLPIALIFLDWEWVGKKLQVGLETKKQSGAFSLRIPIFIGFVASILLIVSAFSSQLNSRLIYPFGPFRMYSNLEASPPFDLHRPWFTRESIWEIETSPPLTLEDRAFFLRKFRAIWQYEDAPKTLDLAGREWFKAKGYDIKSLTVKYGIYEIKPHPDRNVTVLKTLHFPAD